MGREQAEFSPVTERQYNLLKGLYNSARTMAIDSTMDATIVGFETGTLRELIAEGEGEIAEDIDFHSRDEGWQILDEDGKVKTY